MARNRDFGAFAHIGLLVVVFLVLAEVISAVMQAWPIILGIGLLWLWWSYAKPGKEPVSQAGGQGAQGRQLIVHYPQQNARWHGKRYAGGRRRRHR